MAKAAAKKQWIIVESSGEETHVHCAIIISLTNKKRVRLFHGLQLVSRF
jgi:hypothetical protein